MNRRLVQKLPVKAKGLAIGFGFPASFDPGIRAALSDWHIVLTDDAPATLGSQGLQDFRRVANLDADTPLLLIGNGDGAKTVFCLFLSNHTRTVIGAAVFDGGDPLPFVLSETWARMVERDAAGRSPRLLADLGNDVPASSRERGPAVPEEPESRVARLLALHYGPASAALPAPEPPEG